MIKTEHPYNGNEKLIRTYTDDDTKVLLQNETGVIYNQAIDVYPCRYTYTEVDKLDTAPPEMYLP